MLSVDVICLVDSVGIMRVWVIWLDEFCKVETSGLYRGIDK